MVYGEYALPERPIPKRAEISFETAAALVTVGETAYRALHQPARGAAAPQGVDRVLDCSGAGILADSVALTGDATRVLTIADMSAAQHGVRFSAGGPAERLPKTLPELVAAAAGRLVLPLGDAYPLADAARAHADIESRRVRGKVVLLP
ncbi:zinc-binding dehydrogenase [Streptomyces griseofuscus]|uniref:zinc-binding dehydrogenase n=1 Tax=Streptomyces griseofuscus TaxID=146922 RepID=UPI003804DB85